MLTCRFCGEYHQYEKPPTYNDILEGYSAHESVCGNKTYFCTLCQQYIRVMYQAEHTRVFHQRI